jgi:hypothetical protein
MCGTKPLANCADSALSNSRSPFPGSPIAAHAMDAKQESHSHWCGYVLRFGYV